MLAVEAVTQGFLAFSRERKQLNLQGTLWLVSAQLTSANYVPHSLYLH